jgi:hypothetical protein
MIGGRGVNWFYTHTPSNLKNFEPPSLPGGRSVTPASSNLDLNFRREKQVVIADIIIQSTLSARRGSNPVKRRTALGKPHRQASPS